MRRRLRVSVRARLTGGFACCMAGILVVLGVFLYQRLGAHLLAAVDQNLRARAAVAVDLWQPEGAAALGGRPLLDPDEAFGQVVDRAGRVLVGTPGYTGAPLLLPEQLRSVRGPTYGTRAGRPGTDPARILAAPAAGTPAVVVVGATLGDRQDALHHLLLLYAVAAPVALTVSSALVWLVTGAALRPVERIRRRAETISHTDPAARLPVPDTGDEIGRLAVTLNDVLGRLQAGMEREHRFVDDASHELRTPLAVLKAELDLTSARPRTRDELAATVAAAARETDRLVQLAEDLLVLARARGGRLPVHRGEVRLPDVLDEAVAPFRARFAQRGAELSVEAPDRTVTLDPARLRQAVQNLLDNSLLHGAGPVEVRAAVEPGRLRIEVSDRGPGFPDDVLGRAFVPFTRGCDGRSAGTPSGRIGSGLGLAVVDAVARAHGGAAAAGNRPDGGAWVRLDLRT
jgi:signal transduction histidine kinase